MRKIWIGAIANQNGKATRVAIVLGNISQKSSRMIVITKVAAHTANPSSNPDVLPTSIASFVAKAAMRVLTRLFQMRIVIRSLSVLSFNHISCCALLLPFLTNDSIRCLGTDIIPISLEEKNADAIIRNINHIIVHESIVLYNFLKKIKYLTEV